LFFPTCNEKNSNCRRETYNEGECFTRVNIYKGINSVKFSCTKDIVIVYSYWGLGCIGTPLLDNYPTGKCILDMNGFHTSY